MKQFERENQILLDKVRLCFRAQPQLLESLMLINVGERLYFNELCLIRVYEDDAYLNVYCIHELTDNGERYFGRFKFNLKIGGIQGNMFDHSTRKSWIAIDNAVLYDEDRLRFIYVIETELGLALNNITILELCRDVSFNVPKVIKRYLHDSDITTILNRSVIHDRKNECPEISYHYNGSLDHQLKNLTVYIKQANAINNKNKGLTIKTYNKKHEIETCSGKQYILEYYNNPKSLYRLEIEANSEEISLYLNKRDIQMSLDILFDHELFEDMYYYFIGRVLRFRRGAKNVLPWKSILDGNTDKHPSQGKRLTANT